MTELHWDSIVCTTEVLPGPCFSIKTIFAGMGISIINIRQPQGCLIFIMGIPIMVREHLYWISPLVPKRLMLSTCAESLSMSAILFSTYNNTNGTQGSMMGTTYKNTGTSRRAYVMNVYWCYIPYASLHSYKTNDWRQAQSSPSII